MSRRRAPRLGSYRVLGRLATGPDGTVYRAYDATTMTEVLLVDATEGGGAAADRVALRLASLPPAEVVEAHPDLERTWAVLPAADRQRAVELVGLEAVPEQNWFAAAYGWPHLRPRTWSQVAFRSLVLVVAAWLVVSLGFLILR